MIRRIRSRVLLAGATLAVVAGLGVSVAAQGGPGRRGGFGPGGPGRAALPLGQLELTETQRQQVREVMQRHRDQMQEAARRLRDAQRAQQGAVETVPLNEGLIRSTSQTLANAQIDMALVRARIHTDVWSLLTPEQQQKAKELREQRAKRAAERLERQRQRRPR